MRPALDSQRLRRLYNRIARRYDCQHALLTARSDQRGRELLVKLALAPGDRVLDAGAGTGSSGLRAARRVGESGRVTLLDSSPGMLAVARQRIERAQLQGRVAVVDGDMHRLPFADNSFDAVLSSYSLCPLADPLQAVRELFRVTRPGGCIAIVHSTEPRSPLLKWLAARVEALIWRLPALSLGCRPVEVAPLLESMGCKLVFSRRIGVPLWPFLVLVAERPRGEQG
ncbi:methyltransferase domain-containing protein [Aestuariirhabdus litorea]|uniref:Methyltransferase domain-containing protein n=1 Tax=Aestuariirhabdus litorea TaxID=2528527 RepID=A0A3P3VS85_9GAMM|nr:methyltransferase domain-containing protein [Aestuariirhabdus litorea]RRJ85177.1 methyltransferase domain-containing protein [Aestuariirhabdus litorea]RWW98399.1 methyltransferase domain-containing protein [Endozoicomonadaceae bacterium GTF-13]